jgi:hypothetical protein
MGVGWPAIDYGIGWHYRRPLRLFPGLSLNLGRRGFSGVSVGNRRRTLHSPGGETREDDLTGNPAELNRGPPQHWSAVIPRFRWRSRSRDFSASALRSTRITRDSDFRPMSGLPPEARSSTVEMFDAARCVPTSISKTTLPFRRGSWPGAQPRRYQLSLSGIKCAPISPSRGRSDP